MDNIKNYEKMIKRLQKDYKNLNEQMNKNSNKN